LSSLDKTQELQMLEHNIQNLLLQKQATEIELAEIEASITELKNAGDEVFKIIGQLMLKSDKKKIEKELLEKQKINKNRLETLQNQEKIYLERLEKLSKEKQSKN